MLAIAATALAPAVALAASSSERGSPFVSCEKMEKELEIRRGFERISNNGSTRSEIGDLIRSAQFNCMCGDETLARVQFRQAEEILESRADPSLSDKVARHRMNLARMYFQSQIEQYCSLDPEGSE